MSEVKAVLSYSPKQKKKKSKNKKRKSKKNELSNNSKTNSFYKINSNISTGVGYNDGKHDENDKFRTSNYGLERDNNNRGRLNLKNTSSPHSGRKNDHESYSNFVSENICSPISFKVKHSSDIFEKSMTFPDKNYIPEKFVNTFHWDENIESLYQKIAYLNNQVNRLVQEKEFLYYVKCNWNILSDSEVDIIFKRKELSEKYSGVLKDLVSDLISESISVEELNQFRVSAKKNCKETSVIPEDCLFAVDCSADPPADINSSIPKYEKSFVDECLSPSSETLQNNDKNMIPKKNYRKFAIAARRGRLGAVSSGRYHVQGNNEKEFKPGCISDELREALNLRKNQIPLYVYRMRVLDYPPGWLYEAAVESSGITLYGSDGTAEKPENFEDGEVDPSSIQVQYDPDKLIDYPGFNAALPPGFIDEAGTYGLPKLQTHQLRSVREQNMTKPNVRPNRKRKLTLKSGKPSKIQRLEEDMEIDQSDNEESNEGSVDCTPEFVPPLPNTAPPPPPPPPPADDDVDSILLSKFALDCLNENSSSLKSEVDNFKAKAATDISSGTSSPSLVELEEMKKKLMLELEKNPPSDTSQDCNLADVVSDDSYVIADEFVAAENDEDVLEDHPTCSEACETKTLNKSKSVTLGTPSLSEHSSFKKLPAYELFSKNVSSHINFENLPSSTGTYEKLKKVLKKVKEQINSVI